MEEKATGGGGGGEEMEERRIEGRSRVASKFAAVLQT
jgi:hypothetical protein